PSAPAFSTAPLPPFLLIPPTSTSLYTLSLHDALPIYAGTARPREHLGQRGGHGEQHRAADGGRGPGDDLRRPPRTRRRPDQSVQDRKSTRLNSSHVSISYAVFCLKKKKQITNTHPKPP